MKVYNKKTDRIEILPKVIQDKDIRYTSNMSVDELICVGYYPIKFSSPAFNRRYYFLEETRFVHNAVYINHFKEAAKPLDALKTLLLKELKLVQAQKLSRMDWYWQRELKTKIPVPVNIQEKSNLIYKTASSKEIEIEDFSTLEELIYFEATPYEVEELGFDGVKSLVTKYKNNIKEW